MENKDKEVIIPVSEETETLKRDIVGILNNLKPILDKKTYSLLYDDMYLKINDENETVSSETANELKSKFPDMWSFYINMSGSSIREKLREFYIALEPYKAYFELSQGIDNIEDLIKNPNNLKDRKNIKKIIETMSLMKGLNYSISPKLFESGFDVLYKAIVLSDNDDIITEANNYDLLRETIGRKVQKYINNKNKSIDYDGIDHETIAYIREKEYGIVDTRRKAINAMNEIKSQLQDRLKEIETINERKRQNNALVQSNIAHLIRRLNKINRDIRVEASKRNLKILLNVLLFSILPASVMVGYSSGKSNAEGNPLYKTETHITDLSGETPSEIVSYSEYDDTKTDYVSTVMMATEWEKTLSNSDVYSRNVTYYDFNKPEDAIEPYVLNKEDLIPSNLEYKYSYRETVSGQENLNDSTIVVTETFQNKNDYIIDEGKVNSGIIYGSVIGSVLMALGFYLNKKYNPNMYEEIKDSTETIHDLKKDARIVRNDIKDYKESAKAELEELKELLRDKRSQDDSYGLRLK